MDFSISSVDFHVMVWKKIYTKDAILLQSFYYVEVMKKSVILIDCYRELEFTKSSQNLSRHCFKYRGIVLSCSLNKTSEERRLAAAPVSISPLAFISKINMGILRRGGITCWMGRVKLCRARRELIATFSQLFNSDGTGGWCGPCRSSILAQCVLVYCTCDK